MGDPRLPEQGECRFDYPEGGSYVGPVTGRHRLLAAEVSPEQLVGTIEEVETHDPDPKPDEDVDPWDTVSSEFGSLGDRLKDTYRRVAADRGPSEDEIKGAFATLIGAWDQVAESVTTALRDPEAREHLKKAASSFATALGATISDLGDEFKGHSDEEE
jgi:hypothetical protein